MSAKDAVFCFDRKRVIAASFVPMVRCRVPLSSFNVSAQKAGNAKLDARVVALAVPQMAAVVIAKSVINH